MDVFGGDFSCHILLSSLDSVAHIIKPPPQTRPCLHVSLHPDAELVDISQSGVQREPSVAGKAIQSQDKEHPRLEQGHQAGELGQTLPDC